MKKKFFNKVILLLLFLNILIFNVPFANATDQKTPCEQAFDNCVEQTVIPFLYSNVPGAILIADIEYANCVLGYIWCVTYVGN